MARGWPFPRRLNTGSGSMAAAHKAGFGGAASEACMNKPDPRGFTLVGPDLLPEVQAHGGTMCGLLGAEGAVTPIGLDTRHL